MNVEDAQLPYAKLAGRPLSFLAMMVAGQPAHLAPKMGTAQMETHLTSAGPVTGRTPAPTPACDDAVLHAKLGRPIVDRLDILPPGAPVRTGAETDVAVTMSTRRCRPTCRRRRRRRPPRPGRF